MTHVTFEVVPHDGGWANRQGGIYCETFPTKVLAHAAAAQAAREQTVRARARKLNMRISPANGMRSMPAAMIAR